MAEFGRQLADLVMMPQSPEPAPAAPALPPGTPEMKPYDPTMRERMAGALQTGMEKMGMDRYKARQRAQTFTGGQSSVLPGGMGFADVLPYLGTALQSQEAVRGGEAAMQSAKEGDLIGAGVEAGFAALNLIPGAAATAKALKQSRKMADRTIPVPLREPQGVTYATSQEGPFYRVRPNVTEAAPRQGRGTKESVGPAPIVGGSARGDVPQPITDEAVQQVIQQPDNFVRRIADEYSLTNTGSPYELPEIPQSSLLKQAPIGRVFGLAATDDPTYKRVVFDSYARQYPQLLEQSGAQNYDQLLEAAYRQLAQETEQQFRKLPINMSYHRAGEGNYENSKELLRDIYGNRHMYVFQGGDPHDFLNKVDPATGLNTNEMFRAVHDFFGHAIHGNQFGPKGEEIAWAAHSKMFSPLARLAMTAETRGQNSFVNYTPINAELKAEINRLNGEAYEASRRGNTKMLDEINKDLKEAWSSFQFAPQKSVILPPEFLDLNYAGGMPRAIQPLVRPQAGTTTGAQLTHFSQQPGLTMTDPAMYGTGIKGEELARLQGEPGAVMERSYFYAGDPSTIRPEPGLGPYRYGAQSSELYDIAADPLQLGTLARESQRIPYTSPYNKGLLAGDPATDLERLVKEYGYEGLINPNLSQPTAIMFKPKEVRPFKKGGKVTFTDSIDAMRLQLARGGGIKEKAKSAIKEAAKSAGMKEPVVAEKDLTTLQDTHTTLSDQIRERVAEANKMMEGFDYKYDKGQRIFTKDSAAKNKPPYTIIDRTRVGNQVMTEDGTPFGKKIIDPTTGRAKRTPYEPGYRVRYEQGDDWSEFTIPASAVLGDVEMAGGGAIRDVLKEKLKSALGVAVKTEVPEQKMLQGFYRGYAGDYDATKAAAQDAGVYVSPQRRVGEFYSEKRAAQTGQDPHVEMILADPFSGREYGHATSGTGRNPPIMTRARELAPEDVKGRTQLKKSGGYVSPDPVGNDLRSILGLKVGGDAAKAKVKEKAKEFLKPKKGAEEVSKEERMAALIESERALPLRLARAPAKPQKEIAAHAERVGRQMLGEHVTSGKKGDTKNLAGRSMKESQRVKTIEYELEPTKILPESQVYEPRIGDINVAFPGDYSVSDVMLKSLQGRPIGSLQQGGSRYGLGKLDMDNPLFWASNLGPAQLAQDKITDVAHLFAPERVLAHHLAMGPVATNFAQHFADANLRAIDLSKMSKKDINAFNKIIAGGYDLKNQKTGKIESVTFPNWPGIENQEAAYEAMKADPELRKWFNNRMKTPSVTQAINMPSGLDVQWAITHPELRNMEVNLTGHSVGEMVPEAQLTETAEHATYNRGIPGRYLGHQGQLTPFVISFPDAAQHIASTKRPQDFTGTIQKVFPHQIVDQQYMDEVGEYERQLKKILFGKKKGGAVKKRKVKITHSKDAQMLALLKKG